MAILINRHRLNAKPGAITVIQTEDHNFSPVSVGWYGGQLVMFAEHEPDLLALDSDAPCVLVRLVGTGGEVPLGKWEFLASVQSGAFTFHVYWRLTTFPVEIQKVKRLYLRKQEH